ncbi:sigma-54-dependent transcriptional regulator [Salidesulfovibrio onnuriiensis]|uniref:sigma-54-dependent transcriptional regulator n=1 Tax=Salidesulfovibrio onnuriiensis TaxID=2583823 RepID=UPI0011C962BA|nr:sigma-54 dependent transcriptional regulator [Salidesulfovibrio onnuriiensis]
MAVRILVVDDDQAFQGLLVDALTDKGYEVETAATAEEGIEKARNGSFDLALHDVKLPGMSGVDALPHLAEAAPGMDVIVMTGYATKGSGVEAMKRGAYDYFTKPFSMGEMDVVIRRALEKRKLQRELSTLRKNLRADSPLEALIGQSEAMMLVKERIERVAELDADVLVVGETGTGKELVSDTIHGLSSRVSGPFIKINCAAIPESLLESELFGHEKGAFTGAGAVKKGKFELAEGGTILLDEIGDMPIHLQPKLLRAVEQKQVERLGGISPISFDVRIIAATNQELEQRVRDGAFRSDLYYRLNVATIQLPPLRQRMDDLPLLAEHFIRRANRRLGTDILGIAPDAMAAMMAYDWPGNVRQLANAVERASIFCKGSHITRAEVDLAFSKAVQGGEETASVILDGETTLKQALQEYERAVISAALARTSGVQTEAAALLGVSPKNLWNKLQKHHLDPAEFIVR